MSCFFILKYKNVVVIEWKFILMLFNCEYVLLNNVIDNKIIKVIIIIIEIIILKKYIEKERKFIYV